MTSKDLFEKILIDLREDPYLSSFKYVKSYCLLFIQEGDLRKSIELEHWSDFEDLCIRPIYGVKFGVLNEWFKEYNTLSKADQKANSDVFFEGIDGLTRAPWNEYKFRKDGVDYQVAIDLLRTDLVICSKFVFDNNDTLEKLYTNEIIPILEGTRKLGVNDLGSNWIFRYLRLCQLVEPDKYWKLKRILMNHFEFMQSRGEPNILRYQETIGDILNILESNLKT